MNGPSCNSDMQAGEMSSMSNYQATAAGNRNFKSQQRHNSVVTGATQPSPMTMSTTGAGSGGNPIYSSMDESSFTPFTSGGASQRVHLKDHRKFDKDKPKPYLDWNDFLAYMTGDQALVSVAGGDNNERPSIVNDIIQHLTGIEF